MSEQELSPALAERVEEVCHELPGYPGYHSHEDRELCDNAIRELLLEEMGIFHGHLTSLHTYLVTQDKKKLYKQVYELMQKLETIQDKMQMVPYSASPFFKVDILSEDTHLNVLQNDTALLDSLRDIREILTPTLEENSEFKKLIDNCRQRIFSLEKQVESRLSTIMEFQL